MNQESRNTGKVERLSRVCTRPETTCVLGDEPFHLPVFLIDLYV